MLKAKILLQTKTFRAISACQQHSNASSHKTEFEAPKPFSQIPQPKKLPLIGTMLDYSKRRNFDPLLIHHLFQKRHRELGPIFKENPLPGLTSPVVHISAPDDVEAVYRHEQKWPNRPVFDPITRGRELNKMSPGIFGYQGQQWYNIRKFYNENLLTNKIIATYTEQHLEVGNDLADYIEKNLDKNSEIPDIEEVIQKWALECTTVFAMNAKIGLFKGEVTEEAKNFIKETRRLLSCWNDLVNAVPFWKFVKNKKARDLEKVQKEHFAALRNYMDQQKQKFGVSRFQQIIDESDLDEKDKEVVIVDVIGAGLDTTSNAAAFVLYCLASNPEKQEILRKEINELFASGKEITGRTLQSMKYMHAVNLETQRLFPLTVFLQRKLHTELVLSGYQVPAETTVQFNANITNHRDSKYFDNPDEFVPERWLDRSHNKGNKFTLSGSFGMGSRMCPGRRFAMQEVESLVIALLSRFKLEYHHEPIDQHVRLIGIPSKTPMYTFIPLKK